jgi:hypothetical protein
MDPAAAPVGDRLALRLRLARASTVTVVALAVVVYIWAVSGGTWTQWPTYSGYYQRLADAFSRGQTCLVEPPHPSLLALPDPYDPVTNRPFALHDASLFRGRYYLYWGPVPAVVIAAINNVLRVPAVPDQAVVFTAAGGTTVFAALLLMRLWRRHFTDQPAWTPALGVALVALATPTPFNLARPMIYEASIHAAQMFFAAGMYLVARGLDPPVRRDRPRSGVLLVSATCFACAVGCRAGVGLAAIGVAACVCWRCLRMPAESGGRPRPCILATAAFLLPLYAGALALAGYNFARFDSPLELGIRHQLAGFHSPKETPRLIRVRHVGPNLATYATEPVPESELFPFVRAPAGQSYGLADLIRRPVQQIGRGVPAGLTWATPFAVFAVVPLVVSLGRGRRRRSLWTDHEPDARRFVPWFALTLGVCAVALAAPAMLLAVSGAHLRYQADWTPTLMLLAIVGFWLARRGLEEHRGARRVVTAVALFAAAVTIALGPVMAVTRTPSHFSVQRTAPFVDPERR